MKSTGIVRRVDELGRIVLPMELRKCMDINIKDPLEIFTEGEFILIKKYQPACIFCNEATDVVNYNNKNICRGCLEEINKRII